MYMSFCFFCKDHFQIQEAKKLENTIIFWLEIDDKLLVYVGGIHSADFKSQILLSELGSKNLYKHINIIFVRAILFFFCKNHFQIQQSRKLEKTIILRLKTDDKLLLYVREYILLILRSRLSLLSWAPRDLYEHINIILVQAILFFSASTNFRYRKLKNLKNTIIL